MYIGTSSWDPAQERFWKFKAAIFHQLGVKSAVRAKIDVLEKIPHIAGLIFALG